MQLSAQNVPQKVDPLSPFPLLTTRRSWERFENKRDGSVIKVSFARNREHDSKQLKQKKLIRGFIN